MKRQVKCDCNVIPELDVGLGRTDEQSCQVCETHHGVLVYLIYMAYCVVRRTSSLFEFLCEGLPYLDLQTYSPLFSLTAENAPHVGYTVSSRQPMTFDAKY